MKFLNDYFSEYKRLLKFDEKEIHKILALKRPLKSKKVKKNFDIWKWWKCCKCKSLVLI